MADENPFVYDEVPLDPAVAASQSARAKALRKQLGFVRQGGHTLRFHTMQTLKPDTVGHHSFNVAWLVSLLGVHLSMEERYYLVMAALAHDCPEQNTGDIPAPSKRAIPGLHDQLHGLEAEMLTDVGLNYEATLSPEAKRVLKLADALDGAFYCCTERAMGNKLIAPAYRNFMNYATALLTVKYQPEVELMEYASELWEKANG